MSLRLPGIPPRTLRLPERLRAEGIAPNMPPRDAWRCLREAEGERANMIDLYALVAAPRELLPNELPAAERLELWHFAAPIIWPGYTDAKGEIILDILERATAWRRSAAEAGGTRL
jgi:hypothetical protein